GDAHPIVGDDMSEDDADEETQPSASAEFAFSVIRAAEGEGAAPAVEPGKGKPPTSRLPTTESSSQMRIPAMLFTATRDRALGLLLTESAVIKSWQLDEAESRVATAIAHGTDTNLARMLVELGYLTWEDLGPYLERLYGEETESVILPTFSPDGIAKDISERLPGASSSSASGVRLPVPGQLARPRTSQVMRSQLPPPAPAAPPQKLPASAVQVPPPSGPAVAPLPGDLPSIRARLRDRQSSPGESPVSAPAPPVGGPKVVQQRDLTPRVPEKKKKKKSARQPVQPRQQRAPKHTLQVQEVPALPPHLGGDAGGGRPRGFATPDDQPVGELTGRVGEDRFSVTGALGFSAGGIDLRDAADLAADEAALRRLQDAGLTTPGSLLDDPARLADNRAKYVRLDEIARGGMGAIVRARDRDTRRDVAMKILEDGHDRDKMHRFLEEVQITGQLEHPNIVPVHDVGLDRFGRLFFTMKLVRGESLSAILQQIARRDERGAPPYKDYTLNRLVDLFMRVCDAIAFAHSRGVIHRDLKPENILVGEYGEALVMDWGVAKVLKRKQTDQLAPPPGAPGSRSSRRAGAGSRGMKYGAEPVERRTRVVSDRSEDSALQSQLGDITGTPSYMPPEQARGEVHRLDERTDIYSLGAVLYEILTLHAPFEAESIFVILKDVLEKEPVPPSQRAPKRFIPHELESIVLRAMSKEPEHRYANVPSLQRDIQAWLDGKRVETVDYTALQVLMHWARRHSAAVGVMMFLAIALMLVGGFVWNSLLDERSSAVAAAARERSRADALERRAAR
ncbi:MAG: serine/threonine-protein kinase, partial [Planctomycetota bacterium]